MAYIYLEPTDLQSFIDSLKDFADTYEEQMEGVRTTNRVHDDPGDVALVIGEGLLMASFAYDLRTQAAELQTRLDEAVAMNSSGVTPMSGSMIAYYLPDGGEYSHDTVDNVVAFNSASATGASRDAAALDQALSSEDGQAADGRTVEQVLAEQDKHKDVPAYAATYVSTVGLDGYMDLPQRLGANYTTVEKTDGNHGYTPRYEAVTDHEAASQATGVLGSMLAAVSQPGVTITDPSTGKQVTDLAQAVDAALSETGHLGRVSGLNAMMENTVDTVYHADFLVDLATRMEDRDYDGTTPEDVLGADGHGGACTGSSMDPMAGVLTAMGYNPEAAMQYLAPDGEVGFEGSWVPGDKAQDRWELLSTRTWDPRGGYDGLATALGGASSLRVHDPDGPQDEKAAWITGQGMDYLADKADSEDVEYSSTARNSIAIMLGNSLDDMEEMLARRSSGSAVYDKTAYDSHRPAFMAGDHSEAIRALTGIAGTDDTALQTMATAVGRHSTMRAQATIDAYPDVTLGQSSEFDNEVGAGVRADGQLLGFISQSAIDIRTQAAVSAAQAQEDVVAASLGGLSTGLSSVPHPVTQAAGVAISLTSPVITEEVGAVDLSGVDAAQALVDRSQRSLEHTTVALLANNDRLDQGAYYDVHGEDYATGHEWMREDHTIDTASVLTSTEHGRQFEDWLRDASIPEVTLKNTLAGGIQDGQHSASHH
ncbi:DUF6571 family protein [Actinomyces wuliandei]|uniref:DUF6571 family protein n=1 Tax=Actinomyces wuliandei TaxID=2057743 RepID=UPI00111B3FDF|nr:DUF6571 family protein [Actinomyces wuliandei]